MLYTYRKAILLILVVFLLLVGGGIAVTLHIWEKPAAQPAKPAYNVTTTGLAKTPTPLPANVITLIEQSVDQVVTSRHGSGKYTATYRDGSYNRVVYPSGAIATSVLIDVKETHETYLFTRTGGDNATAASTSYIRCAPDSEQMVHPSVCKDPAEGY